MYKRQRLDDIIDQDHYIQQLEKKSGFSRNIIDQLINQNTAVRIETAEPPKIPKFQNQRLLDKYIRAERDLLYYMMNDKNVAMMYEAKAGFMFNDIYRIIASSVSYTHLDVYKRQIRSLCKLFL